jgi:hypothetical protein
MEEKEEPNYQQIIDDEYQFPIFSEDPTEQNRLNVRHALKKAQSGMQLSEADSKLLNDNGFKPLNSGIAANDPLVDTLLLAAPFLAKPAILGGALTGLGNIIKKYPGKSFEVAATALGGASEDPQDVALETTAFKADTMFGGVRPTSIKKLASIIEEVWSQSPFAQTTDGINIPFFMSKSDDAAGGLRDFSKVTSPEYENIILSGMERMGMKDGIFNIDLYNQNSNILAEMSDTLGGTVMKSGIRRTKKLGKRNWMEYFLSPESLKGNFEALRKEGKVAANLEWEDFLKSKGLTTQDIQVHHINPLYDSIHLFDGVKWGSDGYWEIISELIGSGARPGIVQRGDDVTNVIRTLGKSSLTDTPHGIAHAYYKDLVPTFFSKSERDLMKLEPGYRLEKTKEWARIVNQSEDIVVKAHKAWEALNPRSRMPFDELVEQMAAYDNMGILKGISIKYQVKDIQELVKEIQYQDLQIRFQELDAAEEAAWLQNLEKEFIMDIIENMSKKDLKRKWGKKYNLKQSGMKQLDLFLK